MSPIFSVVRALPAWGVFVGCALSAAGQDYLLPQGDETLMLGSLAGDQVRPALSLNRTNRVLVWEDSSLDHKGTGIGLSFLDAGTFTGSAILQANKTATTNQNKPAVAQLAKGQVAIVWESVVAGTPDIYLRLWNKGAFTTADLRVNTYVTDQQIGPAITALADGSMIIAWSSYGQDGDMWGVFARKVTATAAAAKKEFQVNTVKAYSQRDPALATLANGNFVVVWTSENARKLGRADIYARIFKPDCTAVTAEIPINPGTNACSRPSVAATSDGGFVVAWTERDSVVETNSLDIWGRSFTAAGAAAGGAKRINLFTYGDQSAPKIAAGPAGCMIVWTSLGQDGSQEGVFGRYWLNGTGPVGNEVAVNTTTISKQMHPAVAWNGTDRFVVAWTCMQVGGFDLFCQQYVLNANP